MENNKQILTITDAALNRVKFLMKKTGSQTWYNIFQKKIYGLRINA